MSVSGADPAAAQQQVIKPKAASHPDDINWYGNKVEGAQVVVTASSPGNAALGLRHALFSPMPFVKQVIDNNPPARISTACMV